MLYTNLWGHIEACCRFSDLQRRPPWELCSRGLLDQIQDDLRCSRNISIFKLPNKSRLDAFTPVSGILNIWPPSSVQSFCSMQELLTPDGMGTHYLIFGLPKIIFILCEHNKIWKITEFIFTYSLLSIIMLVIALQVRTAEPQYSWSRHQLDNLYLFRGSHSFCKDLSSCCLCVLLQLSYCRPIADYQLPPYMQLSADPTGTGPSTAVLQSIIGR